ncbi:MAG: hypothetical protein U0935_15635 [Pirellulales bacterium]
MLRTWQIGVVVVLLGVVQAGGHRGAAQAVAADKPIPLHIAVQKGLVEVEVHGRGGSTGDSVQVGVRRLAPGNVSVVVEPGTVIQPKAGPVQTMALAAVKYRHVEGGWQKADAIELNSDAPQTYILEGYCRDIEKPSPGARDAFEVAGPDRENARVLVQAKKLGATVKVTQSAIWIQRSKLSDDELRRHFQVSVEELDAARQLLVSVEKPEAGREVDLKVAFDRLRRLASRAGSAALKRGDTVEVTEEEVPLKTRAGDKTVATLKKGQQLEVLGVASETVTVRGEVDGQKQRGQLRLAEVKRVRSASRPVLGALLKAASDVELEIFDKVDANSDDAP